MRNLLLTLLFFAIAGFASAQVSSQYTNSSRRMTTYMSLPPETPQKDIQTKFNLQEWSDGIIFFKNPLQQIQRPLIFDIYNNQLYYQENGQIMQFITPVHQFLMKVINEKDSSTILFRNNYPNIGRNTDSTFYEVIVDGELQLLKCRAKSIYLYKDTKVEEEDRRTSKELLFAYLPNKKMVLIKKDKNDILRQMPDYAANIETIINAQKLKLKNESSLKQLFLELNTSYQ